MLFPSNNTGFSSVTPTNVSGSGSDSTSSRSSASMSSGESSLLTSSHGSLLGNGFQFINGGGRRLTFSSASSESVSVGSSPTPNEEGMGDLLQHTAALLALNTKSRSWDGEILNEACASGDDSGVRSKPLLTTSTTKEPFKNTVANLAAVSNVNTCRIFERAFNQQSSKLPHLSLPPISGRKSPKPDSYKTVMCQAWLENNRCNFAENCRFAHGEEELRPCKIPIKNAKYKTKLCDKYTLTGLCPYGNRCLFIHPDANGRNAYIRPDRIHRLQLAKMERERQALASLQSGGASMTTQQQTPLTSRPPLPSNRAHRPPPSWPLEPPMFFHHLDSPQKTLNAITDSAPTSDCENYGTSPALSGSLSSYSLGVSPEISERMLALGDITNRNASTCITSSISSLSELGSGDSAKDDSPDGYVSPNPQTSNTDVGWSTMDSDPFRLAIANDNLARHLATIFTHD